MVEEEEAALSAAVSTTPTEQAVLMLVGRSPPPSPRNSWSSPASPLRTSSDGLLSLADTGRQPSQKKLVPDEALAPYCEALPWCLFSSARENQAEALAQQRAPYEGTAADWVVETLFGSFKEVVAEKLTLLNKLSLESTYTLADIFMPARDQSFVEIVRSLVSVSKPFSNVLATALFSWRAGRHAPLGQLKHILEGFKISVKDGAALLEERYQTACDYALLYTLSSFVEESSEEGVTEALCTLLLDNFEYVTRLEKTDRKAGPEPVSQCIAATKKQVQDMFATLVGLLSKSRLKQVTTRFLKELQPPLNGSASRTRALVLLPCLRCVCLRLDSKHGTAASAEFLTRLAEHFHHDNIRSCGKEVKAALVEIAVQLLSPLAVTDFKSGVKYDAWWKVVADILDVVRKFKKPKHLFPLMSVLLCVSDAATFQKNLQPFVENLLKLKAYIRRCLGGADTGGCSGTLLQQAAAALFPPGRRLLLAGGTAAVETLDRYVEVICCVAAARPDLAMQIIFDLLKNPDQKNTDIPAPDRMIVGLRAFAAIVCDSVPDADLHYDTQDARPHYPHHGEGALHAAVNIDPYHKKMSDFMGLILFALESMHTAAQGIFSTPPRSLAGSDVGTGTLSVLLLQATVTCIPFVFPRHYEKESVVSRVVKWMTYSDGAVRASSTTAAMQIMSWYPSLRSELVSCLADQIITFSNKNQHTHKLLNHLSHLLDLWTALLRAPETPVPPCVRGRDVNTAMLGPQTLTVFDVDYLEAGCLVILCNPHTKWRVIAFDILKKAQTITQLLLGAVDDPSSLGFSPIRVIDVIEEEGPVILPRLHQHNDRFYVPLEAHFSTSLAKTVFDLAASVLPRDQLMWTHCLGDLVKRIQLVCPETVHTAWKLVAARLPGVQPSDSDSRSALPSLSTLLDTATEENSALWRNYCMFACATAMPEPDSDRKKTDTGSAPTCAKDLFAMICPFLKSVTTEAYRDVAVLALERANEESLEVLFDVLKPYETPDMKLNKKKRDRLKTTTSMIRAYVCENMRQGTLVRNEGLFRSFVNWATEHASLFVAPSGEWVWDNLLFARYNFCVVLRRIFEEARFGKRDPTLPQSLRLTLFTLLSKFSQSEIIFREEVTKKRINADFLSLIRDPDRRTEIEEVLLEHTLYLQYAACTALPAVLHGTVFSDSKDPANPVFQWADSIFDREIQNPQKFPKPRRAQELLPQNACYGLVSFLKTNQESIELAVEKCYSGREKESEWYFLALVELAKELPLTVFDNALPRLLHLIIFKAGDTKNFIRQAAYELMWYVGTRLDSGRIVVLSFSSETCMPETYAQTQCSMSTELSNLCPDRANELFIEAASRLLSCRGVLEEKKMLAYVIPWLEKVDLTLSKSQQGGLLEACFLLTSLYTSDHPLLIKSLWATLASKSYNVGIIVDKLIRMGTHKTFHPFVGLAKCVCLSLCSVAARNTIDCLISDLSQEEAKSDGTQTPGGTPPKTDPASAKVLWKFNQLLPDCSMGTRPTSRSHFILIVLSELAHECGEEFRAHLSVILQLIFLGFDYPTLPVYEHCRCLLLNLIRSLAVRRLHLEGEAQSETEEFTNCMDLCTLLQTKDGRRAVYGDMGPGSYGRNIHHGSLGCNIPDVLQSRVTHVLAALSRGTELREKWGLEAHSWAVGCPDTQQACRSFQLYRILQPPVKVEHLFDTLARLCSCIALPNSFANDKLILECLLTLKVMVERLHSSKLVLFPQIFWGAVALLFADSQTVFFHGILLLQVLLEKFSFSDRAIQSVISASIPDTDLWKNFIGVQPLSLRGLLSPSSEQDTLKLLASITLLPCDEVFDPDPARFVTNAVAQLPWLLKEISGKQGPHLLVAEKLGVAADARGNKSLAKIFAKYSEGMYTDVGTFVSDVTEPLAKVLVQAKKVDHAFLILSSLINSCNGKYAPGTLQLMNALVTAVPSASLLEPHVVPTLYSPLLRVVVPCTQNREVLSATSRRGPSTPCCNCH
eukprot:TRINITY_DN643_c1_g5_i2.p1 TRINITY_DN643_c1_g5~~TRINITY_DN643_c1_g5_i2.p1  ORF type:complete len:1984 (+),score=483.57 TRINITY_DN643_c1_g5_i2:3-5954(+)